MTDSKAAPAPDARGGPRFGRFGRFGRVGDDFTAAHCLPVAFLHGGKDAIIWPQATAITRFLIASPPLRRQTKATCFAYYSPVRNHRGGGRSCVPETEKKPAVSSTMRYTCPCLQGLGPEMYCSDKGVPSRRQIPGPWTRWGVWLTASHAGCGKTTSLGLIIVFVGSGFVCH